MKLINYIALATHTENVILQCTYMVIATSIIVAKLLHDSVSVTMEQQTDYTSALCIQRNDLPFQPLLYANGPVNIYAFISAESSPVWFILWLVFVACQVLGWFLNGSGVT